MDAYDCHTLFCNKLASNVIEIILMVEARYYNIFDEFFLGLAFYNKNQSIIHSGCPLLMLFVHSSPNV